MMQHRRVAPDEVEPLHAIIVACGRRLRERFGLPHWDPPIALELFRQQAQSREVHALLDEGRLIGTFTVGITPLVEYPAHYFAPVEPALYLNRLAVHPDQQSRGYGRRAMALVEELARERGARSVRLDAITAHPPLLEFYRKLGYREAGPWHIGPLEITVFEKLL